MIVNYDCEMFVAQARGFSGRWFCQKNKTIIKIIKRQIFVEEVSKLGTVTLGMTTFGMTTLSIMTLRIMTQHNDTA
jgi:hypothetical protein